MGWKGRVGHYLISNASPDQVKITEIAAGNGEFALIIFLLARRR